MAFPRLRDGFDSRYPLHSENSAFWLIFELCSKSIALALEFSLYFDKRKSHFVAFKPCRNFYNVKNLRGLNQILIPLFFFEDKKFCVIMILKWKTKKLRQIKDF